MAAVIYLARTEIGVTVGRAGEAWRMYITPLAQTLISLCDELTQAMLPALRYAEARTSPSPHGAAIWWSSAPQALELQATHHFGIA